MKLARLVAAATCSCVLWPASAVAQTCDQRYPGSCRLETSTTIVRTTGETAPAAPRLLQHVIEKIKGETTTAAPQPQSSKRIKRARRPLATSGKRLAARARPTAIASIPMPPRPPRRNALLAATDPTTVVEQPPFARRNAVPSAAKPTTVVDQAFNTLTLSDSTDVALEAALMLRRNHILESALH